MSGKPHNDRWWLDPLGQPAWMQRWNRQRKPSTLFWLRLVAAIIAAAVAGYWLARFLTSPRRPWLMLLNVAWFGGQSIFAARRLPLLRREAAAADGDGAPGR